MEFNGVVRRHIVRERLRRTLTLGVLALAGLLMIGEAALVVSPSALLAQAGSTSTGASVVANPINSLYAELEGRSETLTEREAAILEREIAAGIEERQRNSAVLLYAVFGLLVMILINSAFDFVEIRELHTLERQLKYRA